LQGATVLSQKTVADRLSELLSEKSFRIFSVTRLSVSYSKRSTKQADLQSIFMITLPIEKLQFDVL